MLLQLLTFNTPWGSSEWSEELVLQGIWWDRSLDSWMFFRNRFYDPNPCYCYSAAQTSLTPWTEARQASLSTTIPWNLLKLMSIKSVMPSSHLIHCYPLFFLPLSFPVSGSFPMSQFLTSGGQSIRASVSASLPLMNIQDWFPLGLTGLISLLSKGLSRVFSSTTALKHQFFGAQLSLWSNSHLHTWLPEKP